MALEGLLRVLWGFKSGSGNKHNHLPVGEEKKNCHLPMRVKEGYFLDEDKD